MGGLNCLQGLSLLVNYFKITPQDFERISQVLADKNLSQEVNFQQFKTSSLIFMIVGLIFLASGLGVILRKEWARKMTLYFSFAIIIMILVASLAQPASVGFFMTFVIYFGIIIFYFTNKRVGDYFIKPLRKEEG